MKQLLLLLSLYLLLAGCRKHTPYYYKIVDLQLYNEDNSGKDIVDTSSIDIPARAYAIRLEYTKQLIDSLGGQDDESGSRLLYLAKSFTVTSLTDFDSLHPAGSELNSYFRYNIARGWTLPGDSIPALIAKGWIGTSGYYSSFRPPETWTGSEYLVLMKQPAFFGNRTFVIHVEFSNNTSFTKTTSVNLLP